MKTNHQTAKYVSIFIALCVSRLLFSSCSQDDGNISDIEETTYNYTGVPITVTIANAEIEYFENSTVTRSGETKMKTAYRKPLDTNYDIITEVESMPEIKQPATRANLGNAVRFRIVAYKNNAVSTANYVGQADYYINGNVGAPVLVNGSKDLALKQGSYKFVCYSYNTNTAITAFNGTGTTAIPVTHGQDFLVCVLNNVSIIPNANSQFTLPTIVFSHLCSRLQIVVTSTVGNLSTCTATLNNLNNEVTYNLGSTELNDTGINGNINITWPNISTATAESNVSYLLPMSLRTITVNLVSFKIGSTTYQNKSFSINCAFAKEKDYKITVKLVRKGFTLDDVDFVLSQGNLIKNGNTYSFAAKQSDKGSLFGWNTLSDVPNVYNKGTYSVSNDPCKKVDAIWRTPSKTDLDDLNKIADRVWGTMNGVQGLWIGGVDKGVFFAAWGWRDQNGYVFENSKVYYWSSSGGNGIQAWNLNIAQGATTITTVARDRHNGYTIRCIADK